MVNQRVQECGISLVTRQYVSVERTEILASETLEEDDDNIFSGKTRISGLSGNTGRVRLMDGSKNAFQLALVGIVFRTDVGILADGAQHREWRVENQRGVIRTDNKLIGGADLNGATVPKSATHASPAQIACDQQRQRLHNVIAASRLNLGFRRTIKFVEGDHQHDEQQHEIPMAQEFITNDSSQFVVATKLTEESHCRPSGGILEIDGIAQIHRQSQSVDNDIYPFADTLPQVSLFQVTGQEDHQNVKCIGIGNGGGVEIESSNDNAPRIEGKHMVVGAEILQQESQTCHPISHIKQQEVPHDSPNGSMIAGFHHAGLFKVANGLVSFVPYTAG